MSPLATLAFELCIVGDTGLKTGWVRCRHGAGGGGVVTYFADRIGQPREFGVCVATFFIAVLSKLPVRMEFALDELLTI